MSGELMLRQAAAVVANRRETYGDPVTSMTAIAQRWSITLDQPITPAQVALCLIDLKLARLTHQPDHIDSMVDIAGYAAVLREVSP
jgi:hypothetical protein